MNLHCAIGLIVCSAAGAQQLAVEEIMARVAANQDRAQEMRRAFVYNQKLLIRFHRGNGKLAREERCEYLVTPTEKGVQKKLLSFAGKYEHKGKYVAFDEPGYQYKEMDLDGDLMKDLAEDLVHDRQGKDGIGHDLFPLTAGQQKKYSFKLAGSEQHRGRKAWKVRFEPPKGREWEGPWAGEALIDAEEFQPVRVATHLAARLPLFVKTVLGTNIKGLGFSLTYEKFDDGIWFPVSYGGEFEIRAVFFYKRTMSISMANSGFQKTTALSTVAYHTDEK